MSAKGMFAIVCIFLLGVFGWFLLGSASQLRSYQMESSLGQAVGSIWGEAIEQPAPRFSVMIPGSRTPRPLIPSANNITVNLALEQRRKGLLWYPTYVVDFSAAYAVTNNSSVGRKVRMHFPFPSSSATYDNVAVALDDSPLDTLVNAEHGINEIIELAPAETRRVEISYRTRGLWSWRYRLTPDGGRVRKLGMRIDTDFKAVDYPAGSLAPMSSEATDTGLKLVWRADDLITRQPVAIQMPEKLNPGPLSARMSFFAPFCLLFFFVLIGAIGILRNIRIHPMHYLFVTGGFFAFHLLFAYLIDIINVHIAFAVTSLVSVGLVISYLRAALGSPFPWRLAVAGQLFYLVLFSYSFFIDGMTGLTITIGSIITLAVLMRFTAGIDWHRVFAKPAQPTDATTAP